MSVPEHIRKVERPVNTVVVDSGKNGPKRYAVRCRAGVRYVKNGNPQPISGKVIGHIVGDRFVAAVAKTAEKGPDRLSYGAAAFAYSVSQDILDELLDVYDPREAYMIMAMASLKSIHPKIPARRIGVSYARSFLCRFYPGIPLSEDTVSKFMTRLGKDGGKREAFYQRRTAAVMEGHHIIIDGMLKQDSSSVNDLSALSYKSRKKGYKEISVVYAFDLEAHEPLCAEVFRGNTIDASAYANFIRHNNISHGIIVADKGFPPYMIKAELAERPGLHFLTPIKRNDARISNNDMLRFDGVLKGYDDKITYRKCAIKGGRFLYAFRSAEKEAAENKVFLEKRKQQGNFDNSEYEHRRRLFGVVVFESDLDMEPAAVYECYTYRWQLELVFRRYKSDECLDRTRVHGDFSVIGSEFINFIATVLTNRMVRKAREAGLLNDKSFGDLMEDLGTAWRYVDSPEEPASDDDGWNDVRLYALEEMEKLGLSKPVPAPEPKKRGRPKKDPATDKLKRPRGRPRKIQLS